MSMFYRSSVRIIVSFLGSLLVACAPTPESNVFGYVVAERLGTLPRPEAHPASDTQGWAPGGALTGLVHDVAGRPIGGAAVVVAERTGRPHATFTDDQGRYHIANIPPDQYTPAAVAPGYEEIALADKLGVPVLVTIRTGETATAPPIQLAPLSVAPLPAPFPSAANLTLTSSVVVTAVFPVGSVAQMHSFQFDHDGLTVDTLRLYLPVNLARDDRAPMLFMVYPTYVDLWQSVSAAFAGQGYALVAISPMVQRGTDISAHAADARMGLELARHGALSPHIASEQIVALGGSFSSAILYQLNRTTGGAISGWVTVGGVSNAFAGAADFYAGRLELPVERQYLIPALGLPNIYPLLYLRYSPVYSAAELPPTLIIHTDVDRVIPINQAYELEEALRTAGVPVTVFYYQDVSHYLQIDENITDAGKEMFYRVLEFADQISKTN
jgi:dipeptidyl aminopeptidase/acylaminoacyl peptidase